MIRVNSALSKQCSGFVAMGSDSKEELTKLPAKTSDATVRFQGGDSVTINIGDGEMRE